MAQRKGINHFFTEVLQLKIANKRWSWGGVDQLGRRVVLRVWEDLLQTRGQKEYIGVDWDEDDPGYLSPGIPERKTHLRMIEAGATGYGVLCQPIFPKEGGRKIASFDDKVVLKFGPSRRWDGKTFLEVVDRISVAEFLNEQSRASSVFSDLIELTRSKISETQREVLVQARIGQGRFRSDVLALWNERCAVTGCTVLEVIRASHIKPWSKCTNQQRLDPHNGLPLVANLDALFDAMLITFSQTGVCIVSNRVSKECQKQLGLNGLRLQMKPSSATLNYLQEHRQACGLE